MMENFTLLSVVIFIMFLITAGMIIVRKIEFVRALPALVSSQPYWLVCRLQVMEKILLILSSFKVL